MPASTPDCNGCCWGFPPEVAEYSEEDGGEEEKKKRPQEFKPYWYEPFPSCKAEEWGLGCSSTAVEASLSQCRNLFWVKRRRRSRMVVDKIRCRPAKTVGPRRHCPLTREALTAALDSGHASHQRINFAKTSIVSGTTTCHRAMQFPRSAEVADPRSTLVPAWPPPISDSEWFQMKGQAQTPYDSSALSLMRWPRHLICRWVGRDALSFLKNPHYGQTRRRWCLSGVGGDTYTPWSW